MDFVDELERLAAADPSPFRAQLMREDAARLRQLEVLAKGTADVEAYRRAGRRLGWTAQDARTGELGDALDALLDAVHEAAYDDAAAHARVRDAWRDLANVRMERLVGCLSTPVPKPSE